VILANLEHTGASRPGITFDRGRLCDMVFGNPGEPGSYTQKRWLHDNKEYYDDRWGNIWVRKVDGCVKGEIQKPALPDWDALASFKAPIYDVSRTADILHRDFSQDASGEKFRVACIGGWVFDNARYLRKLEVYLLDMALYPDELKIVHAEVAKMYESLILSAAKAGAEAIYIGEDMGTQTGLLFSPQMFRDYFKEMYSSLMALAHENGMKVLMHSCGHNRAILEDLIDCGVDAFQFDQPTVYDFDDLSALFRRRRVALWSPVDIQKVLPTGNHSYIQAETEKMCRAFDGFLIVKVYPDLPGIGVDEEWDQWGYQAVLDYCNGNDQLTR